MPVNALNALGRSSVGKWGTWVCTRIARQLAAGLARCTVTPLPEHSATYTEPHAHPHSNQLSAGSRPAPSARVRPPSPRWWRCSPTTGAAHHRRLDPCYCSSHPAALLTASCCLLSCAAAMGSRMPGVPGCRGVPHADRTAVQHTQHAAATVVHAASWPLLTSHSQVACPSERGSRCGCHLGGQVRQGVCLGQGVCQEILRLGQGLPWRPGLATNVCCCSFDGTMQAPLCSAIPGCSACRSCMGRASPGCTACRMCCVGCTLVALANRGHAAVLPYRCVCSS